MCRNKSAIAYIVAVKKILLLSIILNLAIDMNAQTNPSVPGEYYLRGVMEVGSGFKLDPDSSFQFFFSYGALDRSGSGTWSVVNKKVIFNSRKYPGSDFALVAGKKTDDPGMTIRITDPNKIFLSHVYCILHSGGKQYEGFSNNEGLIQFPVKSADSLTLAFEFCAERSSTITLADPTHNDLSFTFEPWIMEVFFNDFSLNITPDGLEGQHPLLKPGTYRFEKH